MEKYTVYCARVRFISRNEILYVAVVSEYVEIQTGCKEVSVYCKFRYLPTEKNYKCVLCIVRDKLR